MSETTNTILARRSIREFLNRPIPDGDLQQVIQAALHAPSGMGKQTWQFTMVKNREKIRGLISMIRTVLNREGYDMYRSEVFVIPFNGRESPFGREDNACVMENIFLTAHPMRTGSVWTSQLQGICDDPAVHQVLSSLGTPRGHVVYGTTTLRYADDEKAEEGRIGRAVIVE